MISSNLNQYFHLGNIFLLLFLHKSTYRLLIKYNLTSKYQRDILDLGV